MHSTDALESLLPVSPREPRQPLAENYVKKSEAAGHLGIGIRTLEAWMADGLVPYYRIGNVVRFRLPELDSVMRRFRHQELGS